MNCRRAVRCFGFVGSLLWLSLAAGSFEGRPLQNKAPSPEQAEFFEKRIRPVLVAQCVGCHGAAVQMAGLRLDTRDGVFKGGNGGPAIVAGKPAESLLIQAIRHEEGLAMPKGGKLKDAEIADFQAWVTMGAPWPDGRPSGGGARPSLWSLQPVKRPRVPEIKGADHPIDAFLLQKLNGKKLGLSPPADRRTLLRRLSYDLTGLPPSPEEVFAFLTDKSPNAYSKVVDSLLASPRYGERQARLWMDVARYADTKGYVFEEDRVYHHAYTYREWLIKAFNEDLPYDQFIQRQLAADRLPAVRDGDDKSSLAALGFLTLGRRFLNNMPDIIDDRIDVAMRGFQGLTVSCARCHDHKFDPIPTQDYYSLYAVFANSAEQLSPISERAIREPWEQHSRRLAAADGAIRSLVQAEVKKLRLRFSSPDASKELSQEVRQTLQMLREEVVPEGEVLRKLRSAFESGENEKLERLMADAAALRRNAPPSPEFAMAMSDVPNPRDGVVFTRGNPGLRGGPAPRRYLAALAPPDGDRELWRNGSGRLELAQAIASKDNPLTARVFANRIWQQHFGVGIVRTPSDFGHQGEPPTHSELLDYLASAFMDGGWSVKKLHRLIVTSAAYRQSSSVSKSAVVADPENRLYSRMNRRRLDLEQMRDSMLLASGRLDLSQIGGKSADLWSEPFSRRRTVYGFIERQNLPGVFRTFDFAGPDATSARRFETTVPQQALFLMNSGFSASQARAMAERADVASAQSDAQRIRRIYLALFGRLPDSEEAEAGSAFLAMPGSGAPPPTWRYGYGTVDSIANRVLGFTPLPHFAENGYRAGPAFPDPNLGWLLLNAQGGHPGKGLTRAIVRRWAAPGSATIAVGGLLKHPNAQGDGVRARVISSRVGLAGDWRAHNREVRTDIARIEVQKGDLLDFVVDSVTDEGFDGFVWSVSVRDVSSGQAWDSVKGFGPPRGAGLNRLGLYIQALMMSNEFFFVD